MNLKSVIWNSDFERNCVQQIWKERLHSIMALKIFQQYKRFSICAKVFFHPSLSCKANRWLDDHHWGERRKIPWIMISVIRPCLICWLLSLLFSLFHWIQQQQDDIIDRSVPRPPRSHNFTVKPPVLPKVTYLADKDRPNHDLHLHPRHSALKNDILVQLTGTLEMQSFRHAKSHGRSVLKIHFFIE